MTDLERVRDNIQTIRIFKDKLTGLYIDAEQIKALRATPWLRGRLTCDTGELEKMAARWAEDIRKRNDEIQAITDRIDAIEKPVYREVLRLRYLQPVRPTEKQIAAILNKSASWTRHICADAVKEYERMVQYGKD